uniref:Hybrid signal transduction histidine kinase M n=1 Tax=Tanacetum cinerariifolium TaxID=118510 RepID=A0A6L2P6I9_TANCI|nr:hybrid signal transduction histidine kinase M [Tanacetum cinerariifolium]
MLTVIWCESMVIEFTELRSLKLADLSIDAYFRKIESIATIVTSLGSPISNDDFVTIALEGFPDKYANVSGIIIHQEPFLDLKIARSMLTTEDIRPISHTSRPISHTSWPNQFINRLLLRWPNMLLTRCNINCPTCLSPDPISTGPTVYESGHPVGQSGQQGQLAGHETLLPHAFHAMTLHDPARQLEHGYMCDLSFK